MLFEEYSIKFLKFKNENKFLNIWPGKIFFTSINQHIFSLVQITNFIKIEPGYAK